MRITTSINEPFVISTYAASHRLPKKSNSEGKSPANIFATHAAGRSDGYATVTVQADGVHVLDVSTLHPVASHTLGPSTTFPCPAVTQNIVQGTDNIFTTYAAVEGSPDISAEEVGRTIWMWQENMSSSLAERASQKKKSVVMPHLITKLHTSEELPSRLLVLSPKADLTILDAEMRVRSTRTSPQDCTMLQTFVFPRQSCGFAPARSSPERGVLVVMLTASGNSAYVHVIVVDDSDNISEAGNCSVPLTVDKIINASCSNTGYMTFLTRDGTWHSFQLESPNGDVLTLSHANESFGLANLSFTLHSQATSEVSLLALGSSHVLLAAVSNPPAQDIVLLLWDLQYSVLLASHTLPIPSSLSDSKDVSIRLTLVPTSTSQALLLLSPTHSPTSDRKSISTSTSRSSVLVLPFTAPPHSSIANAMGRGAAGAKWMVGNASGSGSAPYDASRAKVLATMRVAMEKNLPEAANVAFFEWEKRERAAEEPTTAVTTPEENTPNSNTCPTLGYSFVKDLLTTVLQPSKPPNIPYSSEIVRHLLSKQAVSANMVEGGLLSILRSKNDWQSIDIALHSVLDIPETEMVDCLYVVVRRHRENELASAGDAMQVDSITDLPALPPFLATCITYATTPAALRVALRRSLKDPDDILAVMKVLEMWINQWSKRDVKLLPSKKEVSKNEHGVQVLKKKGKEVNKDLPPLNKVLSFLQTMLDAFFVILLQHMPAHRTLQTLSAHLEPEITFANQLEQLRGPLETFARAQGKAVKDAAALGKDGKKEPVGDWRQRRKLAHEQAGIAVGLYRLEELML